MSYGAYQKAPYGVWTFQIVLPVTLFVCAFLTHYFISVPVGAHLRKQLDAYAAARMTNSGAKYGTLGHAKAVPGAMLARSMV